MRVSAVLAVYNAAWCIERALDSVLAQSRPVDEVLVCDDGSTDGTPDLIEGRYGAAVTVLRLPHRNASATRRVGTAQARGDWLALLDADDRWLPEKLERQLAFLARHPEVRWCGTDGQLVGQQGVVRHSWLEDYFDPVRDLAGDLLPPLVERCFPLVSAMLVEREAYQAVGGLDPRIVYSHDYDLWLRLAARYPGGVLAERLVEYYTGPGTLSRQIEARYRDDLGLMRRVARGELGRRPGIQRIAAERAAALEFDLALVALRAGRAAETRERLWRAAAHGPWKRRLLAAGGALAPAWAHGRLMRSGWLKQSVAAARREPPRLGPEGRVEDSR
ncbi:MAG: glycosyltransferase [Candidatus Eisenbacteria bacterium]|nr:glycosyltransferase [Candidatus Eisenbacteria bacterium]